MNECSKAVFLDRDGVIIDDVHLLNDIKQISIISGVPSGLKRLKNLGFKLILVTNQPVVARGMLTIEDVINIHSVMQEKISSLGGPTFDCIKFCPHHPDATLKQYRKNCLCRKPKPGMLLEATRQYNINLSKSYMIGDRISDIVAGKTIGTTTILLKSGRHTEKPIVTSEPFDKNISPDYEFNTFTQIIDFISSKT